MSSYYLKTPLCLLLITWCAQEKVYISEHKAKELVGLQSVRRRISLPRNTSPGVSGEGRGREKICHPKQLTPRGVEESPTGISTNDMKGRATSAIKKLWTSNPVGKMEEKGKALSWCMERKNHHAIAERSLFGLGWQYPWDGASQCHEQRGVGGWNWFSGLRRSSPQKCRVTCWATTTLLSTSVSRASDPQLYSSSLQPRTHILCAVAWKTYCGVIQLNSRDCSIAQSSVSKAIVKTQPRIKASSAWLKMVDFLIAVAGLCTWGRCRCKPWRLSH